MQYNLLCTRHKQSKTVIVKSNKFTNDNEKSKQALTTTSIFLQNRTMAFWTPEDMDISK